MKRISSAIRNFFAKKKQEREDRKFNKWWLSLRASVSDVMAKEGYGPLLPLNDVENHLRKAGHSAETPLSDADRLHSLISLYRAQ
jgi:hypothetical protein